LLICLCFAFSSTSGSLSDICENADMGRRPTVTYGILEEIRVQSNLEAVCNRELAGCIGVIIKSSFFLSKNRSGKGMWSFLYVLKSH
jgi:hypothetical protein